VTVEQSIAVAVPADTVRDGAIAPVLRTEGLTVRFGGLPPLKRVNSEASETKGLALDVIAPLTR